MPANFILDHLDIIVTDYLGFMMVILVLEQISKIVIIPNFIQNIFPGLLKGVVTVVPDGSYPASLGPQ